MEEWKDIIGMEGKYQISTLCRMKSLERTVRFGKTWKVIKERICSPCLNSSGYYVICLGKYKRQYLHRLVALAFIPNPEKKPQINHINGIKTDNRIENLEWVTVKENNVHAFRIGLNKGYSRYGTENNQCHISFSDIEHIRAMKGSSTLKDCAEKYNVSISHVWQIQNNKVRIAQ